MKTVVVDASVAIKWFVPEIHSEAAAALLEDEDLVLAAPDLIVAELGNTLWKKIRRDEMSSDEASEVIRAFGTLGIEIHSSTVLLPAALEIATSLDRSVYDSFYLALAVARKCVLVTADRRFHDAVRATALAPHMRWVEA